MRNVVFVAPFFMRATLQFVEGAANLPGVSLILLSQDPLEKCPEGLRRKLAAHHRVANALDPQILTQAVAEIGRKVGGVHRLIGTLEQLQIPLAQVRATLGIDGVPPDTARNFREKSVMKDVLRANQIPCARHALALSSDEARSFAQKVGFPLVAKPPDGAGSMGTFRLHTDEDLDRTLAAHVPSPNRPMLLEEFIMGNEFTFESAWIDGDMVWHSITRYFPNPLQVLENPWIQMCMLLPREIDHPYFNDIRQVAGDAIRALGLRNGFTHLEWFRRMDGTIAVSEVAVRPPGGQLTSMTGYAHNFDIHKAWAALAVFDHWDAPRREYATGTVFLRGQGKGRVKAVHGLDRIQEKLGDMIVEAKLPKQGQPGSSTYEGEGYLILRHPQTSVIEKALDYILASIRVELA